MIPSPIVVKMTHLQAAKLNVNLPVSPSQGGGGGQNAFINHEICVRKTHFKEIVSTAGNGKNMRISQMFTWTVYYTYIEKKITFSI